jgi:adenylate cyclase
MAQVFVSYARATESFAKLVADRLRSQGHGVWRDDELPAHRTYGEVIEERLKAANAVVVLWSADAARSQWVRAEADAARQAGTLVQASVDGTVPPLPFNQIQCADLTGWDGAGDHHGWRKLKASVAALIAGPAEQLGDAGEQRPTVRNTKCVCVLPFANMSGDPEQEYFSDGISEDITTDLSKVSALAVIARNTAFTFKGTSVDVPTVARKLGASHILEGSVRKAGDRVRINAQLIDGRTGDHVWAERWDRNLTDIFAIQDEISKAIVDALKVTLLPEEKKAIEQRGTSSAEAYNLYLMARQYWITGNHGDRTREERVTRICSRAIEIDPQYARAWALMAIAQSNLRYGFGVPGDGGVAAAERALELDPTIAEVHCVKSRRLSEEGRIDDALAEVSEALALDPDSWEVNKETARLHMLRRDPQTATRYYQKAVEVMETDYHGWGMLVTCYRGLNDPRAEQAARNSLKQAEHVLAHDPSNGAAMSFAVGALAALGEAERAREWIDRALLIDPDNLNMYYNFGCALAVLGDTEGALKMLQPALERRKGGLGMIEVDPDLESVRDDPRFQEMMAKARLRHAQRSS